MKLRKATFLVLALAVGCNGSPPAADVSAAAPSAASATRSEVDPPVPSASSVPATTVVVPVASAAPSAAVAASAEVPAPSVEVKNIGMHIGGGPNDNETKAPIKRSVEPHFPALAACFAEVVDPAKSGDVSIDLYIDKAGGKAEIRKFRSALEGAGFEPCVRKAFEAIDFERPKTGTTVVSYSLRFTPKKR